MIEQRPLYIGAPHSSLERLISGTVEIFAGLFIGDNFPLVCAECSKGFKLAIEILLACGNASVVKSFMNRFTSKNIRKGIALSGHIRLLQMDLFGWVV